MKRGLCRLCYQKLRRKTGPFLKDNPERLLTPSTSKQHQHGREIEFIRSYFDHDNWIYQPASFRFDNELYSPDFYDGKRNVFIEVSGTRQAYHDNKEKYNKFRNTFPKIALEIRKSNGEILNEESRDKNWEQ